MQLMDITKAYCLVLKRPSLETFAPSFYALEIVCHVLLWLNICICLCFEFDEEASLRMCVLMGATMVWEISQCDKTKRTNYLAE
jgi:hypothetical protein